MSHLKIASISISVVLLGMISACTPPYEEVLVSPPVFDPPATKAASSFFPIIESGLHACYTFLGQSSCPEEGVALYGQDAHYLGLQFDLTDMGDGTVLDNNTGLMWQQVQRDMRVTHSEASALCQVLELGGWDDWRLPNIQELFSIADMSGVIGEYFFLDSHIFDIRYSAPEGSFVNGMTYEEAGQTWSATTGRDDESAYVFNFFNGELRSYDTQQTLFYRCVRGEEYGENDLLKQENGTVLDRATGLIWQQEDRQFVTNWGGALAYCENLELGEADDWRLPDVKELASVAFVLQDKSMFTNHDERGWYWTGSTRVGVPTEAYYLCLDECFSLDGTQDFGDGSIGSDLKYTSGQEESSAVKEVRIDNQVRCVRGGGVQRAYESYRAEDDSDQLLNFETTAQQLGVEVDALRAALEENRFSDPFLQKAAFALGIEVEALRVAVRANLEAVATPPPST